MFIRLRKWVIIFTVAVLGFNAKEVGATHIMGGDIQWERLHRDTVKVIVNLYRDCKGVTFKAVPVVAKSPCGTKSVSPTITLVDEITPVCKEQCTSCSPTTGCTYKYGIQAYRLVAVFYIGDWMSGGCYIGTTFSWEECCRNNAISTGGDRSRFRLEAYGRLYMKGLNKSPKWKWASVALLCTNQDFSRDFGATDSDMDANGKRLDRLEFSLTQPLAGSGNLTWKSPYNWNNPIRYFGFPNDTMPLPFGFHLDAQTGDLSFRPTKEEVTIMAIKVKEYRGKTLVSESMREVQIVVLKCPKTYAPVISGLNCSEPTGAFEISSQNGCVGDSIEFSVCVSDKDLSDTVTLECISELPKGAKFTILDSNSDRQTGKIKWVLDSMDLLRSPITFNFRATDDACPMIREGLRSFRFTIGSKNSMKGVLYHQLIDSGCGKYALFGGKVDSLPVTSQYWYVNDTLVGSGDSVVYNPSSKDTQFVKSLIKRDGCFRVFSDTLVPAAYSPIRVRPFSNRRLCQGTRSVFTDTIQAFGNSRPYTYSWSVDFGTPISSKKDSIIQFAPILTKDRELTIELFVNDSAGCTVSRRQQFPVLASLTSELMDDTSLCTSDSFSIRLETTVDTSGKWFGPGVDRNMFRSSRVKPGLYKVYYQAIKDGYCVTDDAEIDFGPNPMVSVDSLMPTCVVHSEIPLKAKPVGGIWNGDQISASGIVKDSFFKLNRKGIYTLTYKYRDARGCAGKGVTLIDVGVAQPYFSVLPKTDTLCAKGTEIQFQMNSDDVWYVGNGTKAVRHKGGHWYSNQKNLDIGLNKLRFRSIDTNYCIDYDTVDVWFFKLNTPSFITSDKITCVGDDSIEIRFSPDSARLKGDSIVEIGSGKYVFPKDYNIGMNEFIILSNNEVGCSDSAKLRIRVKDTVISNYTIPPVFCAFDTLVLKSLTTSGKWKGNIDIGENQSGSWYATADDKFLGSRFLVYETDLVDACYSFDTSFFKVHLGTKPKVQQFYQACANGEDIELKGKESSVMWSGVSTLQLLDSFYFRPQESLVGKNTIYASKKDSLGCVWENTAVVQLWDIPAKPDAGYDDFICMSPMDVSYKYQLAKGGGTWSGKGVINRSRSVIFYKKDTQRAYEYVTTVTDGRCANHDTVFLHLGRQMKPDFTANKTTGPKPFKVVFTDKTPGVVHNRWSFGTGDTAMNRLYPQYTYLDTGQYDVALVAYDSMRYCGERLIRSNYISVSETNSLSETTGGINIFPNPVRDILVVNSSFKQVNVPYSIYDINGQLLIDGQLDFETGTSLKVSELRPGQYLLELRFSDEDVRSISFIKR